MTRNVGMKERVLRAVGAAGFLVCALVAPLPWALRMLAFASLGVYMMGTALTGTCLGYKWMGRSTCALPPHTRT